MVVGNLDRRMGEVLQKMADELAEKWNIDNADEWLEEINSINNDLEKAWHSVRFARESRRVNPRKIRIQEGRPSLRKQVMNQTSPALMKGSLIYATLPVLFVIPRL